MAQRVSGKSTAFMRGVYIDDEIELMAKVLAKVKKTSINQVFREGIVKLYIQEFGHKPVRSVIRELGLELGVE